MRITPPTKQCTACHEIKDRSEFYTRSQNGKKYPEARCKQCSIKRTKDRIANDDDYRSKRETWTATSVQRTRAKDKANRLSDDPHVLAKIILRDHREADRKKNRENDLTVEFVTEAIQQPCRYCGDTEAKMTLDRQDNAIGHLQSNVVPSCYRCNIARGNMPFLAWMEIAPAMRSAREKGLFGDWMSQPFSRKSVPPSTPDS